MEIVLYGVVMLVAMTLAGVIGFAANVLALPVLSMFLPLKTAVAVLMLIVAVQIVIQAFMYRRNIYWREVGHIVVWTLLGMPIGFVALNVLPQRQPLRASWMMRAGKSPAPFRKNRIISYCFFSQDF